MMTKTIKLLKTKILFLEILLGNEFCQKKGTAKEKTSYISI